MIDWQLLHALWQKWSAACVGYSDAGEPLKAALLLNCNSEAVHSRQFPLIAEQTGIRLKPTDVRHLVESVKENKLHKDFFFIGPTKYLVTSIHDHWYCARCAYTTNPAGEGAIIVQTTCFILVTLYGMVPCYEGSIGAAAEAMAATDYLMEQLSRRNL